MVTRVCAIALCLVSLLAAARADAEPPAYRVIVNPENPAKEIDRRTLANIFLKKTTHWADTESAEPVELGKDTPARRRFIEEVLGRSPAAVRSYWQQAVFSGRELPPVALDSEEAVVRYVLTHRGAVGYVSGDTDIKNAKVVLVR